ncbi:MAG: c-type cytochrome biogenesis protein CcsB [Actinomycetes bacterium]
MVVYTVAMVAFTVDLSGAGRVAERRTAERELVGAGAPSGVPSAAGDGELAGRRSRRAAGVAVALTWLALLLHAAGVVFRGLAVSRVPWSNMYEFAISGAAVVTAVFLVVLLVRDLRYLGTFVVGPVLLTLGVATTTLYTQASALAPALQSEWLIIHVSVAFVSSALFTIAFSANILQLVQDRREQARAAGTPPLRGRFMDALPSAAELERAAYRLIAVSFPLWTFTLVAGAIWAEVAWGRYWGWDPKEVWTFVIWVVYAAYLHARATRGWDGRRAAYLAIAGYVCVLVNFGVVNVLFPGNHSYAGIG